jgi:ABC-2 type transport system ATP-binding protein
VSLEGDHLKVGLPADRAAEVTRVLADRGLYLTELRPETVSLEDVFLELTREPSAPLEEPGR